MRLHRLRKRVEDRMLPKSDNGTPVVGSVSVHGVQQPAVPQDQASRLDTDIHPIGMILKRGTAIQRRVRSPRYQLYPPEPDAQPLSLANLLGPDRYLMRSRPFDLDPA